MEHSRPRGRLDGTMRTTMQDSISDVMGVAFLVVCAVAFLGWCGYLAQIWLDKQESDE